MKKVIIIGNIQLTLELLKEMLTQNVELVGVISGQDNKINSDYADLLPFCELNRISSYQTDEINSSDTIDWIKSKSADVIFCLGWSRIIKRQVLQATPLGVIGYHPTALPKNRGRHPIIWSLVLGLNETASTFFLMDEGVDSGDILSQKVISISLEDDAQSLHKKIIQTAKKQLTSIISCLENGKFNRILQDQSLVNIWRKRSIKDGEIDWRMSASSIYNLIRGLTHPYVGAHFLRNEIKYKVWKSELVVQNEVNNIEPGMVLNIRDKTLIIKCGKNCIKLLEVEPMPKLVIGEYL